MASEVTKVTRPRGPFPGGSLSGFRPSGSYPRVVQFFLATGAGGVYGQNMVDLSFSTCFVCEHTGELLSSPARVFY